MASANSDSTNYIICISVETIPDVQQDHPQQTLHFPHEVNFIFRLIQTRASGSQNDAVQLEREKTLESTHLLTSRVDVEAMRDHVSTMLSNLQQTSDEILSVPLSSETQRLYWRLFPSLSDRQDSVQFEHAVRVIFETTKYAVVNSAMESRPYTRRRVTVEKRFGDYISRATRVRALRREVSPGRSMARQQLSELSPQQPTLPEVWAPAAKSAVESLERVVSWEEELECAICLEKVSVGERVEFLRLPCSHAFHSNCILLWLNLSHTCPMCRFKLPADRDHGC